MKKIIVRTFECLALTCFMTACVAAQPKVSGDKISALASDAKNDAGVAFAPLPKQAAANELWSRILALANLPGGYIARVDFERVFGEGSEGERSEQSPYTIGFGQVPVRDYSVFVSVQPSTRVPFSSTPSSRLINATPSSKLYLAWSGHDCLGLQKVRDDLALIGIVLNEWVRLPVSPGAPPMSPGGYFYRPHGKEYIKITVSKSDFNPNEASEWAEACVTHIEIEGYKEVNAAP